MYHPCLDEHGQRVHISNPSSPCLPQAWADPLHVATVVPGGERPAQLDGIAFARATLPDATAFAGVVEPPFVLPAGLKPAAGAVIVESDGRVWLVAPTNGFGGYAATFPKGRVDPDCGLQATAVREAFEESGLVVDILGHLVDVRRTQTYTRYYAARRVGGDPACMGWETQAVHLVPAGQLEGVAVHANDSAVIAALRHWMKTWPAFRTPHAMRGKLR
jgi:8-oxo-dGTP pyrophosphatase MutT (NUDIX family)